MSKKKNSLLTPEELAAKKIRKSNGWTRFWAIALAFILVVGVFAFAKSNGEKVAAEVKSEETTAGDTAANANASSGWDSSSDANPSSDANANADANQASDANANANANASSGDSNAAATAANAINAATAKAANAGYLWTRDCEIADIDVGSATDTLNGIIKRVDSNADLNSVVGGFLGRGNKKETVAKGGNAEEITGNKNYPIKATSLKAEDLQNLKVEGNKYTFTLPEAQDPQKDNSTALARLTNDFITHDEVVAGVKDALGGLSFLLSVKSSTVVFKDIKVTAEVKDGSLVSLSYSYYMDVQKLELSVATGTGHGTVKGSYSNFSY